VKPLHHPVLPAGPGHRLPETLAAISERDRLLAEAAAVFMSGLSSRAAAREMHIALARYREGAFRREYTADAVPQRRLGRLDGYCWMILRARDHCPSERTIRAAIDAARKPSGLFVAHGDDQAAFDQNKRERHQWPQLRRCFRGSIHRKASMS
jgi:hypothetical protein